CARRPLPGPYPGDHRSNDFVPRDTLQDAPFSLRLAFRRLDAPAGFSVSTVPPDFVNGHDQAARRRRAVTALCPFGQLGYIRLPRGSDSNRAPRRCPVQRAVRDTPGAAFSSGERPLPHVSGRGTNNEAIVPRAQPSAGALVRWACRSDNRTGVGRMTLQRMDNVGIVVESLDAAISFFAELGLELEGRATIEGDWAERVTGLRHMRVEI